jgi:excisionase family DNA binding protein
MPDTQDVISFSEASRVKGCSRTTLYRAVEDGRLNDVEVGDRRMIVKDLKWDFFEPEFTGRRAGKYDDSSD